MATNSRSCTNPNGGNFIRRIWGFVGQVQEIVIMSCNGSGQQNEIRVRVDEYFWKGEN